MNDRPCSDCFWHEPTGCTRFDCKPCKRIDIMPPTREKSEWERLWDEWARKEKTHA